MAHGLPAARAAEATRRTPPILLFASWTFFSSNAVARLRNGRNRSCDAVSLPVSHKRLAIADGAEAFLNRQRQHVAHHSRRYADSSSPGATGAADSRRGGWPGFAFVSLSSPLVLGTAILAATDSCREVPFAPTNSQESLIGDGRRRPPTPVLRARFAEIGKGTGFLEDETGRIQRPCSGSRCAAHRPVLP